MKTMTSILGTIALAAACVVHAQGYPMRPVTILHGFPAGGNPDVALRQIASRLEVRLGQPVIVENRTGASGTIAAAAVARAAPDGYTLLFGVAANLASAPAAMKSPPYDPATAFAPIVEVARGPYLLLVRDDHPARTFADFVAYARSHPGRLNVGSPGQGSVHHLTFETISRTLGLDVVHVAFRGAPYPSLINGDVDAMLETMPGPLPLIEARRIRALAVTGPRRLPGLPDVPTLAESGVADADATSWWGLVGPAGLPPAVIERLNREVRAVLDEPAIESTFRSWQIERIGGTPERFGARIAGDYRRWREVVSKLP